MATVTTVGATLGLQKSTISTPFLGKKLKIKYPYPQNSKNSISNSKPLSTISSATPELVVVDLVHNLFVGVGVGLPCTVMECGDIIYRSTLPRSNALTITAPGVVLALGTLSYLWATPGVAPGFRDMFVLAFVERFFRPTSRKDDFQLGKKLGEGAFGVVNKVSLTKKPGSKEGGLVLKRASEYGAVEIWMNERVRRACANSCADFVYGFLEKSSKKGDEYWLIWRFEEFVQSIISKCKRYQVEATILKEAQDLPKGLEREHVQAPLSRRPAGLGGAAPLICFPRELRFKFLTKYSPTLQLNIQLQACRRYVC